MRPISIPDLGDRSHCRRRRSQLATIDGQTVPPGSASQINAFCGADGYIVVSHLPQPRASLVESTSGPVRGLFEVPGGAAAAACW